MTTGPAASDPTVALPEPPGPPLAAPPDDLALSEMVSRVLDRGVVISGEAVLGVAGVDLVHLGLDLVLTSVATLEERAEEGAGS